MTQPDDDIDRLVEAAFGTMPLRFIRDFMRSHARRELAVPIGGTRDDVRRNLTEALRSRALRLEELASWLRGVGGWGAQHMYLLSAGRGALTQGHLLNTGALRRFLERRSIGATVGGVEDATIGQAIDEVKVDDRVARISWLANGVGWQRRKEMDEIRELADGVYEFRAYRQELRRAISRLVIRKTDGIAILLVDMPLGEDHNTLRAAIATIATTLLAPLALQVVPLSPTITSFDQAAMVPGSRPRRQTTLAIEPALTALATEGGRIQFSSTSEAGYAAAPPVRAVRRAVQIDQFIGESGKFRLHFDTPGRASHDMTVSLDGFENRCYLWAAMDEEEVMMLVDEIIAER